VSIRKSQHLTSTLANLLELCGMAEGVGNGFVECRSRFLGHRGEVGCEEPFCCQNWRRTAAAVTCDTRRRSRRPACLGRGRAASRETRENSASRHGVERAVRPLALGLDPEVVARTSRKVTSTCQRWTYQGRICNGSRVVCVKFSNWSW
jgi:hypothetical protein